MPDDAANVERAAVKRPRLFWLRIAVSLFFGLLTVATIVFWVRSYTFQDHGKLKILPNFYIQVLAGDARMCVWFELRPAVGWFAWWSNELTTHVTAESDNRMPPFDLAFWPHFARLYLAHWVLACTCGFLAAIPWFPRKFSLQNLLVAVTVFSLVAAVVGWVDRTY